VENNNMVRITKEEFEKALTTINQYQMQLEQDFRDANNKVSFISPHLKTNKNSFLFESKISVRCKNILSDYGFKNWSKIKELEGLSMSEFSRMRNAGEQSLTELKELCFFVGINMKP
jgi:DNA-directed RNA polymerase alpha subunit